MVAMSWWWIEVLRFDFLISYDIDGTDSRPSDIKVDSAGALIDWVRSRAPIDG